MDVKVEVTTVVTSTVLKLKGTLECVAAWMLELVEGASTGVGDVNEVDVDEEDDVNVEYVGREYVVVADGDDGWSWGYEEVKEYVGKGEEDGGSEVDKSAVVCGSELYENADEAPPEVALDR